MKKNVIVLVGINGVGKSTIARLLEDALPRSVAVSGSGLLMRAFGGMTREHLEKLSPEEKMRVMEPAFLEAFEQHLGASYLILDTHLVVPIRKSGTLVLENVWSAKYAPYAERVFFISSDPREIMDRRIRDFESSGRHRDVDLEHIRRDQEINLCVFEEIIVPTLPSSVIINSHNGVDVALGAVVQNLDG